MSDDLTKRLRGWDCLASLDCGDAIRDEAAARIDALEAQLAEAVEALEEVKRDCDEQAALGNMPIGRSAWHGLCATLAKIKGAEG